MRNKTKEIHIRLSREEASDLLQKAERCGITQSALIRILLKGFTPKEKPDERFYAVMREMNAIGNNLNQLTAKANSLGFIDAVEYRKLAENFARFQLKVEKEFLAPSENKLRF